MDHPETGLVDELGGVLVNIWRSDQEKVGAGC